MLVKCKWVWSFKNPNFLHHKSICNDCQQNLDVKNDWNWKLKMSQLVWINLKDTRQILISIMELFSHKFWWGLCKGGRGIVYPNPQSTKNVKQYFRTSSSKIQCQPINWGSFSWSVSQPVCQQYFRSFSFPLNSC